jgi:DNA-binding transcriptional LysR family regulator
MQFRRSDFADLSYFLEIAKHRNFRRAGLELGVSASALSHALKGEELRDAILEPYSEIGRAIDVLNRFRDAPAGRVRLNVPTEAAELLVGPVLATFAERYPDLEIEISVSNHMIDVIDSGFDGGIRYGGTVPEDMIAQRLSGDVRWVVVASPAYLERFGVPLHPNDLQAHRCVRIRVGDDRIYRWEFERGDEQLEVDVPGSILVDQAQVGLAAVKGGAGLMYIPEPVVTQLVQAGELRIVLEDWAPTGPGFHLYYSSRRHVPPGLKLFIDLVRELRPLGL